jgi:K+-sensing histidine kinase KdpD
MLGTLTTITRISNDTRLSFDEKLQQILAAVVSCMETERGSIMIVKGRKYLSVAASTDKRLIGAKQAISEDAPSSWVFKNKKTLSIGKGADLKLFSNRYAHYKKTAFLLTPILSHNKVIGIISVTEKIGADRFTASDREVLLTLSGHVISALEKHRLAESLRKSKQLLQVKNEKLKKLEKIRTELFNMLIHDLKGPISEVLANIDILSYTVTGENLDYVESARTGCDTLFRMVADLLDIAKMEEQSLELNVEVIIPSDLIREALSRLQGLSQSRNVLLGERFPKSGETFAIKADRGILLRVLQNLLTNAIQFSPAGETVVTGFESIGPGKILFYVEDNGPGVPPAYRDAVFDKFTQISSRKDGRKYATGLGLTFCKMAVNLHYGSIRIADDGKYGSRFEFILPC